MTGTTPNEEDKVLTLKEYIEEQRQLELEAAIALPNKFDQCTFDKGYLRQDLYVCLDCLEDPASLPAAVCYSCSVSCHSSCNLIELYSRRHFRCDCGNSRFKTKCSLRSSKDPHNVENHYDGFGRHNFHGRFCSCDEPFDSDQEDDQMYQCSLCEDWYHSACIVQGLSSLSSHPPLTSQDIPDPSTFDFMICGRCTGRWPFLTALKHPGLICGPSDIPIPDCKQSVSITSNCHSLVTSFHLQNVGRV